jgi:adenylate cyclase
MRAVTSTSATEHTFVFADLAGYTALTEAHGDAHAAEIAAEFADEVRELLAQYEADEVNAIGDAVLVRVSRAADAVRFAARLASDLGRRHRKLGLRIGVHTGTAVPRGDSWYGSGVNVACRVGALAGAGEILVTSATRDAAGDAVESGQLEARGRRELKNVGDPVEVFALEHEGRGVDGLPVDPVCRMAVEPARASGRRVHGEVEYVFCSETCLTAFDGDPARYCRG